MEVFRRDVRRLLKTRTFWTFLAREDHNFDLSGKLTEKFRNHY